MKVKKFENIQNKIGLKGCKWSSLKAPGTETPQSYPYWEREILPLGKELAPQYEMEKVENFPEQNWLKGLQLIQFECPRH